MADDLGYVGSYSPMILEGTSLDELRNLAGPAPTEGKKWFMVNLFTGECKWYKPQRTRRSYAPRVYVQRNGYRRR